MKRKVIYTIGKGILLLLAFGALATVAVIAPNSLQIIKLFQKRDRRLRKYTPKSITRTLYRLKAQKLISIEKENGQMIIKITKKGKSQALKYNIEEIKIPKPKSWDKKWRLVMFDIPNKKTLARNVLRDKLKELGFFSLQKSIWIYPYECEDEINFIKGVYGVDSYVKMATAEKIDDEEKYLKIFNLKPS